MFFLFVESSGMQQDSFYRIHDRRGIVSFLLQPSLRKDKEIFIYKKLGLCIKLGVCSNGITRTSPVT